MGLRILIADDEAVVRMDLREMLEESGYEVVGEAGDGERAVEVGEEKKPDLAILDIKMPKMNGLEAAEKLMEKGIATLVLTAYADREFIDRAKEIGVLAYLVKPFSKESLIAAIEMAMARFRELQELRKEVSSLREALEVRKLVERAKGLLMKHLGIGEEDAYRYLQRRSMEYRKPMKEVAEAVIIALEIKE
ncbi:response regulator [bacterium]|nr:response regulator [bacterium]